MQKRPQDTPLVARSITRVRKGVYDIKLVHPSGRLYGYERFFASNQATARQQCLRLYPSTIFGQRRKSAMRQEVPAH